MPNKMINQMRNKILIIILILTITASISCKAFAFGNNGKFIKLKNIPQDERIFTYFSPTQIFYPGELSYKNNSSKERTLSTAKIYNIETQKLADLGVKMNIKRTNYIPVRLSDSRIIIFGGYDISKKNNDIFIAEIYDLKTNKFKIIGETNFKHNAHSTSAIILNDGRLLLVHGSHMEIFDPKTNKFILAGKCKTTDESCTLIPYSYNYSKAKKLNNGKVYIEGSLIDKNHNFIKGGFELYDPNTNTLILTKSMRGDMQLTDGRFYSYNNFIYDPVKNIKIQLKESEPHGKWAGEMFPLSDNNVLILGISKPSIVRDLTETNVSRYIEIYDPKNDKYKELSKNILVYKTIPMGNDTFFITTCDNKPYAYLYKYKLKN